MKKAGCAPEIDGKRRIWALLKSICVRSKGGNEVAVGEMEGGGGSFLWERRISLQGTLPLLPLLNSFNKHLTFTGRKINTHRRWLPCVHELLLTAKTNTDKGILHFTYVQIYYMFTLICHLCAKERKTPLYVVLTYVCTKKKKNRLNMQVTHPLAAILDVQQHLSIHRTKAADCIAQLASINLSWWSRHYSFQCSLCCPTNDTA